MRFQYVKNIQVEHGRLHQGLDYIDFDCITFVLKV